MLRELPHTPIAGVGVNFGFIEAVPEAAMLRHFDLVDNAALGQADYAVAETTLCDHWRLAAVR